MEKNDHQSAQYLFLLILLMPLLSCKKEGNIIEQENPDINTCTLQCMNNGILLAGCTCDCLPMYTGSRCETRLFPKAMVVDALVVQQFPGRSAENNWWWDIGYLGGSWSPPDIWFDFKKNGVSFGHTDTLVSQPLSGEIEYVLPKVEPCYNNLSLSLVRGDLPLSISPVTDQMEFVLYDNDGTVNQWMGRLILVPGTYADELPAIIHLAEAGDCGVKAAVYVRWVFDKL